MGVSSIADIRQQLLDGGVSPDLPVAIVENGTTSRQRTIISSAAAVRDDAKKANIVSPAMVFIGESIRAAEQLQWFDGRLVDSDVNDDVVLDDLHSSHIDYLRLIETG